MIIGLTYTHHTRSFRSEYNEAENKRLSVGIKIKEKKKKSHRKLGKEAVRNGRTGLLNPIRHLTLAVAEAAQHFVLGSQSFCVRECAQE